MSTSAYALYPTAPATTTPSYYLPPITTNLSFSSILHKKVLDQSEQQWESDVSQVMWFDHKYNFGYFQCLNTNKHLLNIVGYNHQ